MNATKLSTRNAVPSDVAESIFPRLAHSAFSIQHHDAEEQRLSAEEPSSLCNPKDADGNVVP